MVRIRFAFFTGLALLPGLPLFADPVEQTLALQKAMATGRVLLDQNRPREAVEVLQKELLNAGGNAKYLGLLRDAYSARLKELQLLQANPEEAETLRRQLAILESDAKPGSKAEAKVAMLQPPQPDPTPVNRPVVKAETDPFQQIPLDRLAKGETAPKKTSSDSLSRALTAYDKKNYREANQLFQKVPTEVLDGEAKLAWGYAKLHEVSTRLMSQTDESLPVSELEGEAKIAMQLGGENLQEWGKQVLAKLAKRSPTTGNSSSVPDGWATVESANFRVVHKGMKPVAEEILKAAEAARAAMYERWSGPVAPGWSPKCDVWLHPSGGDYAQSTGQGMTSPGHSTVEIRGGKVTTRRIDLRGDVSEVVDSILPHEVTYLIVQELFADQPLPRWAESAMTVLSEPPSQVSRYLRAVPKLVQEKRLLPVSKLINSSDYPDEATATAFFVGSVSLVDYLIRLKGAKAFAVFLREAPRRGYEKALQTHYGFKDTNELQDKWLKYASGQ